jgi:glutamate 5-kinase
VIPIINENDVVADEEIKAVTVLGDNDRLSALVVKLIRADLLIVLSTVDGLREHTGSGKSKRVRYIESITRQTYKLVADSANPLSQGGMTSKLQAAQTVSESGTSVVIADGRKPGILEKIMAGEDVGTFVLASV